MAIAQHRFYWDKKQSLKSKSQASKTNASNLRNAIDKNSNSLIVPPTEKRNSDIMQRKVNKKVKAPAPTPGKKVPMKPPPEPLSPQVKALEQKMVADLKKRKVDLEDQLYDKVQELKEICKQEFNITEKLPIEYIRYMLPKEQPPVLVKKQQTSFPVQLRHNSTANELQKLESECELLNQITKAAHQLAHDPSSKGRVKRNRIQSYEKSLKKLQDVENRIDELRKKQGQDAAVRQSTLIINSDFDIMAAMKECSIDDKSERSSLSEGNMLEDETSVSSGAEALSTHSTPAILRPESGSADVDMDDVPIQRSRTPPPTKTKVAWLPSPRVKLKKHDQLSPSHSYPVHPSPTSYRSTTSHSSGAETPPNVNNREWAELRWQHPKHPDGWNVSSLDSLESIGSRKSNEHNSHGSPEKRKVGNGDIPNANAMRIARAAESRSNKVNLREKHRALEPSRRQGTVNPVLEIVQDTFPDNSKDSRISLTDSGHGTDSRVQSCYEDDLNRKRNGGHSIRRDISDSSLSELSTQSNPAALPSSGHIPKFVPYFMTNRNRSATQATPPSNEETKKNEHNHVRKRSSSFTESGSTLQKPSSRRDNINMRTLTRSRTQEDERPDNNDAVFGTLTNNKQRPGKDDIDSKNYQGSNEIQQTPIFDTNLNIHRQYLSRSQGQLAQNNPNPNQSSEETTPPSGTPYISVVDKPGAANPANVQRPVYNVSNNNSNIKMNFGQIYKFSQSNQNYLRVNFPGHERVHTTNETGASHNIPKCNSLDSVLDRNHANDGDNATNYPVQHEYPVQYPSYHSPTKNTSPRPGQQPPFHDDRMPNHERDKYNNEAFDEIRGMAWVPSLDEYGSRASVAESLPAKSKREDIREMLQQHFAHHRGPKRTPSSSSTSAMKNKQDRMLQARIRAMMKEQDSQNHPDNALRPDSNANTWEDYKQNFTLKRPQNHGVRSGNATTKSEHTGVNIFAHKPPPPLRQQNQGHFAKTPGTATGYSTGTVHKGYVTENTYIPVVPMGHDPAYHPAFYNNNPDYGTIRSQKSVQNYPTYPVATPAPFERGFFSATLPRKYGSRETSPQQPSNRNISNKPPTPPCSSTNSVNNFPRTYSTPPGVTLQNPSFYPAAKYGLHRHQRSTDSLLSTQSFTSSTHSFPATDERSQPMNHAMSSSRQQKSMQNLQSDRNFYQGKFQQSKSMDALQTKADDESPRRVSESDNGAMVIQATRTSPDGHKVSVFSVKSAPNTPLPPKSKPEKVDENDFFDKAKKDKSSIKDQLSPKSDTSEQSNTDILQALAIEAARTAQKALSASQGSLEKFSSPRNPPPIPLIGPNANLRSSTRNRRATSELGFKSTERGRSEKSTSRDDTGTPKRIPVSEIKTPRSRSKTRRERDANMGRSASPNRSVSANSNGVAIPVKDMRSGAKTPKLRDRSPSPTPATPKFQRTLSTPIRVKPVALKSRSANNSPASGSPQNNKTSGMLKDPMTRAAAKLRPPTAPRVTASTPVPTRSNPKTTTAEQRHLATPRPVYQIGQSGTLPRTPKSHKRIERSGSTSGAAYQANRLARPKATKPDSQNSIGRSYIPTPRKELYHALLGSEDLKYKRSLSETWKQQNLTGAVNMQNHHAGMVDHYQVHPMYRPMGHHGVDPRTAHQDHPRRTASADDLLWPATDGRDQNANLNIRSQQGTLV